MNILDKTYHGCPRKNSDDLSRTELHEDLPRFNMPLELGIFLGAKKYGNEQNNNKACIIFDREQYRYQKFISDISGHDIKSIAAPVFLDTEMM
jgi:hypothetical protein